MTPIQDTVNIVAGIAAGTAVLAAFLYLPWRMHDAYRQTFIALARAVESREPYLLGHAEATARYLVLMARWRGMMPWTIRRLEFAALLHGIGKVSVPYGILNNPDPLQDQTSSITAADRFVLRDYVRVGAAIMDAIPALRSTADIVRYHHEYFDGSGYPFGRYGHGIPFPAQMLCVASEYVAMTAPRLYRDAQVLSPEQAIRFLRRHAGSRYHPSAVFLFVLAKTGEDVWLGARAFVRRCFLATHPAPRSAF